MLQLLLVLVLLLALVVLKWSLQWLGVLWLRIHVIKYIGDRLALWSSISSSVCGGWEFKTVLSSLLLVLLKDGQGVWNGENWLFHLQVEDRHILAVVGVVVGRLNDIHAFK